MERPLAGELNCVYIEPFDLWVQVKFGYELAADFPRDLEQLGEQRGDARTKLRHIGVTVPIPKALPQPAPQSSTGMRSGL